MIKYSGRMVLLVAGFLCVDFAVGSGQPQPPGWIVDGRLEEAFWGQAKTHDLGPWEEGVPQKTGGTLYFTVRGRWLCLAANLPEPGGKVMARSIGDNPTWEKYALTSPAVEDRIRFELFDLSSEGGSHLVVAVNPWGAMRVERDSSLVNESEILRAANISPRGWSVELAVPASDLFLFGSGGEMSLSVKRIRSRRPLSPEYQWKALVGRIAVEEDHTGSTKTSPVMAPPNWGNNDPPLQVGRVQKVPALDIPWDTPYWRAVPGFELPRNEPSPRAPEYPTRVKWVHDGETLQVVFENFEEGRLNVDIDSRDGNVGSDDHVAVYLALSGSATVEILANPVGAIRDALSTGPRAFGASAGLINAGITGNFVKEKDRWIARLNLPLAEIAAALGGKGVPSEWKVLLGRVRQERHGEPAEISAIPVLEVPFLNAPARFRSLHLTDLSPSEIDHPEILVRKDPVDSTSADLENLSPFALSRVQRSYYDVTRMIGRQIDRKTKELAMIEHEEWEAVRSLQAWEEFRDKRMPVLREALGELPSQPCELDYQVSSIYRGEGYRILNIAYQSRPGFYIAANLYLPEDPPEAMPGMIILPAHHYPKTHGEMKDCGMVWARSGVAVLIMEHIGFGERLETSPLHRQAYESESLLSQQLELVGQSLQGWIVYDVMRTVDLFEELGTIDMDRVILIGSVTWGGGRRAAPAGLFEQRIDGQIIYNFGRVYWYGWGTRNLVNNLITPWFVVNAFAPRKLVYAHEFWYEGEEGPGYPEVWVPAWPRYQKVYALYGREENLASAQGIGLLRAGATEFIPRGDCYMLGTVQRKSLYPILERWFDIPYPSQEDQNIPLDSGLSDARRLPDYPVIKYKESLRRPVDQDVLSISAEVSEQMERRALHQIAYEIGADLLETAREKRRGMKPEERRQHLRMGLERMLGSIDPDQHVEVLRGWRRSVTGAEVEALALESEDGTLIPLLLLKPGPDQKADFPVVVALAEGGKSRFLKNRAPQLSRLLRKGFAVCALDVRGTGETASSQYTQGDEPAVSLAELGESLLGGRLKDVRTVLNFLRGRPDFDGERISLWGDSFTPVNEKPIWVDELLSRPVSPQIQHIASPLGAHLALLTALFDPGINAVAVRGGLISYLSLLESNYTYVPPGIVVSRFLEVGDIADIAAALSPLPLLVSAPVTGRNFLASESDVEDQLHLLEDDYGVSAELVLAPGSGDADEEADRLVDWLASR